MALEKLILSLSLTMAIPDDLEMVTETYEQIEDLMECFTNLKLGSGFGLKQGVKSKSEADKERSKALTVLFDILVAQLMKPQSFLREMANYVFKQFCRELDQDSLDNLINIVATPNDRATEMFEPVEDDASMDSDGEVEPDSNEVSDDSDDLE